MHRISQQVVGEVDNDRIRIKLWISRVRFGGQVLDSARTSPLALRLRSGLVKVSDVSNESAGDNGSRQRTDSIFMVGV
jgi:hypothetical protein